MSEKLTREVRIRMEEKSTEELLRLWQENDREQWSEETFEVVKQLLLERGETLLNQKEALQEDKENRKMDEKKRRFSVGGIIVAAIMGLVFLGNLINFLKANFPAEVPYALRIISFMTFLVPTIAMLVRSFRPPVSFRSGLATLFGGILVGMSLIPVAVLVNAVNIVVSLILLVSGVILLKLGFKAPTKAENKKKS